MKNEINDAAIKGLKNLYKLQKENKTINHKILGDIRNFFEHEEKDKPVRVNDFGVPFIKHKSNDDRETLSVKKYLNKVRIYLKDIVYNLKKSGAWKIQLTKTINSISSKKKDRDYDDDDDGNAESVMYS